ncbi:hypothetical protein CEXT_196701 [Caerostris extrusa]|uniref:Uncharacterized protein n=1 Tax=Caerostris extrusa TaxID=172846 RepID=A0AAV4MUC3_CAEEX|nr:hypothetical protein CEXT_196701 [Caerostris extrusa]
MEGGAVKGQQINFGTDEQSSHKKGNRWVEYILQMESTCSATICYPAKMTDKLFLGFLFPWRTISERL